MRVPFGFFFRVVFVVFCFFVIFFRWRGLLFFGCCCCGCSSGIAAWNFRFVAGRGTATSSSSSAVVISGRGSGSGDCLLGSGSGAVMMVATIGAAALCSTCCGLGCARVGAVVVVEFLPVTAATAAGSVAADPVTGGCRGVALILGCSVSLLTAIPVVLLFINTCCCTCTCTCCCCCCCCLLLLEFGTSPWSAVVQLLVVLLVLLFVVLVLGTTPVLSAEDFCGVFIISLRPSHKPLSVLTFRFVIVVATAAVVWCCGVLCFFLSSITVLFHLCTMFLYNVLASLFHDFLSSQNTCTEKKMSSGLF